MIVVRYYLSIIIFSFIIMIVSSANCQFNGRLPLLNNNGLLAATRTVTGNINGTFPLTVSNGVLETVNGSPYLILGDSPQGANSIPLCSAGNTYATCAPGGVLVNDTLPTNATFVAYAKDRQAQGFNSLWINILCESYTGCNNTGATQEGTRPFTTQLSGAGFNGGSNYPTTDSCPENGSV